MTTKDEALALALKALKPRPGMPNPEYQSLMECAIEAIEEVQSRPEQEPVACAECVEIAKAIKAGNARLVFEAILNSIIKPQPAPPRQPDVPAPPQRPPLTDEERFQLRCQWNPEIHGLLHDYLIQQTEAAHGIKGEA